MGAAIYTHGDFTLTRCIDHWIEYPFVNFGDKTTKIYYMVCEVNTANYAALTVGTGNLTDAASAGVIEIPTGFTNPLGRFCNDSARTSISGGLTRFTRKFATLPTSGHSDYSSAVYTSPPVYSQRSTVTEYSTVNGDPIRTKRTSYASTPSKSYVVRVRLDYSYTTTPASATVYTPEGFTITNGTPVIQSSTYSGFSVTEENDGGVTVGTTGTANVIDGTKVSKWLGDIYQVVTAYRI